MWFRVVVGVLAFGMLVELLFVAASMAPPPAAANAPATAGPSAASVERARQFGMTVGQYEELLAKNKAQGISKESVDLGLALAPRVKAACRLPVGHEDRPGICPR